MKFFVGAVAALLILPLLTGCTPDAPKLSTDEQAKFKGGPMPAEAAKGMAERMKAAQNSGGPAAPNAPKQPPVKPQ